MDCRITSHVIRDTCLLVLLALGGGAGASAATIAVNRGDDLQAALDRAQPGDVVALEAGASFTGNFVLRAKAGDRWVTVRSAVPDGQLPARGTRITPAAAGRLARIQSPNADPAMRTAPGAHHWRLLALEFGPGVDGAGDILRLGDGSPAQRTPGEVPHDLVVDRCYVHGAPGQAQKRGIALNSASTEIVNSWIADIKAAGQDSQAIAGWNGPGPFLIENDYLEAAGENFLLGGADPSIEELVPAGVTFRGNWVRKPTAWRGSGWQVKNLFELKNARGVTIENNVFENNWQAAQAGYAILFTPRNQDGHAPWATVRDVTFRGNVVRHVGAGINILGHDSPNESGQAGNVTIADNLLYDVGDAWGGAGTFLQIGDGPSAIVVEHNTVLQSGNIITAYGGSPSSPARIRGFVFRDNLALHNAYGVKGDNSAAGTPTLAAYFPDAAFAGNVIAGGTASAYPAGNAFPSVARFYAQFARPSQDDYRLTSTSPWAKPASDGSVVGADPREIRAALARASDKGPATAERRGPTGSG